MWLETPCTMSRAARRRRASRGPWMLGIRTRTLALALWSISKGQAAGGTETQELAEVVRGYRSCSALLAGGGPHPQLRSPPPSGPGRHRSGDTGVSDSASDFFFSHKTALKKGNEKRPPSWLRFAPEGCFLPAALLLCCNTGNLLLLTPGVVSNSQMVLTSVSCN